MAFCTHTQGCSNSAKTTADDHAMNARGHIFVIGVGAGIVHLPHPHFLAGFDQANTGYACLSCPNISLNVIQPFRLVRSRQTCRSCPNIGVMIARQSEGKAADDASASSSMLSKADEVMVSAGERRRRSCQARASCVSPEDSQLSKAVAVCLSNVV